jgi:hypothetical protein
LRSLRRPLTPSQVIGYALLALAAVIAFVFVLIVVRYALGLGTF